MQDYRVWEDKISAPSNIMSSTNKSNAPKPSQFPFEQIEGAVGASDANSGIFEHYNLPAMFAVLAQPKEFAPNFVKGDFKLWNDLQSSGHKIHPHGYTHAKMPDLAYADGCREIDLCLATFSEKLNHFD